MREILFRAKDAKSKKWVYGNFVKAFDGERYFYQIEIADRHVYRLYDVNPETVGQFIGLKDKNGVKIFEGMNLLTPTGIAKVIYDEYKCCFALLSEGSEAIDYDLTSKLASQSAIAKDDIL